ncbi:hypothetical protein BDW62DRAFT_180114 [Aspergillus aurantiobrunneus]
MTGIRCVTFILVPFLYSSVFLLYRLENSSNNETNSPSPTSHILEVRFRSQLPRQRQSSPLAQPETS